jgi:hypothetical protein
VKYRGNGSEQTEGLPHWFWLGLTKYAPSPPTTLNPLIGGPRGILRRIILFSINSKEKGDKNYTKDTSSIAQY